MLPPASYRRLQEIKAAYDPDQMIISAHPVWPANPGMTRRSTDSHEPQNPGLSSQLTTGSARLGGNPTS